MLQDLADMMAKKSKTKWGNRIGYVLIPFTIALQDDPLDYVRGAKSLIDRKKHSLEPVCTYLCANLLTKLIGANVHFIIHCLFVPIQYCFHNYRYFYGFTGSWSSSTENSFKLHTIVLKLDWSPRRYYF